MKFRSKRSDVDAWCWDGMQATRDLLESLGMDMSIEIPKGHWVIRTAGGEFFTMDGDAFVEAYVAVFPDSKQRSDFPVA